MFLIFLIESLKINTLSFSNLIRKLSK